MRSLGLLRKFFYVAHIESITSVSNIYIRFHTSAFAWLTHIVDVTIRQWIKNSSDATRLFFTSESNPAIGGSAGPRYPLRPQITFSHHNTLPLGCFHCQEVPCLCLPLRLVLEEQEYLSRNVFRSERAPKRMVVQFAEGILLCCCSEKQPRG